MTESEAKEMLQAKLTCMNLEDLSCIEKGCSCDCDDCEYNYAQGTSGEQKEALSVAIKLFEEIQKYRAIGTVEECREAREKQRGKKIIHNPDGRVDEDWLCPSCGRFCSPYFKHCQHCGQSVKVGDAP